MKRRILTAMLLAVLVGTVPTQAAPQPQSQVQVKIVVIDLFTSDQRTTPSQVLREYFELYYDDILKYWRCGGYGFEEDDTPLPPLDGVEDPICAGTDSNEFDDGNKPPYEGGILALIKWLISLHDPTQPEEDSVCGVSAPEIVVDGADNVKPDGTSDLPSHIAHGQVVQAIIEEQVQVCAGTASVYGPDQIDKPAPQAALLSLDGGVLTADDICVTRMETEGWTLENIIDTIETPVRDELSQNENLFFVFNMSWALIPCQDVPTVMAYEALLKLDDADRQVLCTANNLSPADCPTTENFATALRDLIASKTVALESQGGDGPLFDLLTDERIVGIAASGNAGYEYPFYPARYDFVTSVSASYIDPRHDLEPAWFYAAAAPARWSNVGTVMMPGVWEAPDAWDLNVEPNDTDPTDDDKALGTSMAAPRMSVATAYYLWHHDPNAVICPGMHDVNQVPGGPTAVHLVLDNYARIVCPPMFPFLPQP